MTTPRAVSVGVTIVAFACASSLAIATGTLNLPQPVRDTLTPIDSVPTKSQLDSVFPAGDAQGNLAAIAQDAATDTGVRLRAIHALGKYCTAPCASTDVSHESLSALITSTRNETVGESLLVLRAAIETIGPLRVSTDVTLLTGLLDHPSRDIRAATAHALRDLCNSGAVPALIDRYRLPSETSQQVKLAISEALRVLSTCGN
jgi:hypothetical protein